MSAGDAERLAEEFRRTDPTTVHTGCPAPERIWAAVSGELNPEAVRQVVDHTAQCLDCSLAWRVALEVRREDAADVPHAVGTIRPAVRRSLLVPGGFGLAAAAIALVLLRSPFMHPDQRGHADVERGAKRPLVSLTAPGVQHRDAVLLRWSPASEAERYSVTVMNSSLQVLYRGFGLATPELRIPPEAFSGQPSPARLLWSVEATLAGGRTIESDVFTVDVD